MTTTVESLYECREGYFDSGSSILASGDYNSFHGCAAFCVDNPNCYAFQFTNVYDDSVLSPETCKLAAKDDYTGKDGANDGEFKYCEYKRTDGS